jgi:hypothetical protein
MAKIGGEKIEQYQWIMQLSRVHTADCVMAETKKEVVAAFDAFVETWGVKYDKAVERGSRRAARLLRLPGHPCSSGRQGGLRPVNQFSVLLPSVR